MILITNAIIVNENSQNKGNVLIKDGKIAEIFSGDETFENCEIIDAQGKYLLPGVIDSHVHFREPGLTQKGDINSETRAAVAGGVTSFMDMPNTSPLATTNELVYEKFEIAKQKSMANYSFYIGATQKNINELKKVDFSKICGVKLFMGSSTGNMLVDRHNTLEDIFAQTKGLIAVHCEHETMVAMNTKTYREKYGDDVPISCHPSIRSKQACYLASLMAVELAQKHNARLHILHISTARELKLLSNNVELSKKQITGEVCVHHLWFSNADYEKLGGKIKCNPAIKKANDRAQLLQAVIDGRIDVVSTDHAPHTLEEKQKSYFKCPSGIPLVQHSLPAMLEFYHNRRMTIEQIVEKMCHNPASLFAIKERGYIRPGYWADLVLVDTNNAWRVSSKNILYKCGWSPFEGQKFRSKVTHTWVNGNLAYENGKFDENCRGMALEFSPKILTK